MAEPETTNTEQQSDAAAWTLQPHPHELEKAVTTDHVAVFGRDESQLEVSGETDYDDLNIDWSKIDLNGDQVEVILNGKQYVERCEDLEGRTYTLYVRGGQRDPKGTPVHTQEAER